MRTYLDCIPCLVRQAFASMNLTTKEEQTREQIMREVLLMLSDIDLRRSPPAMAQKMHRLIRGSSGVRDPYLQVKKRFNKLALRMYPELKHLTETSEDPLQTAVRLAIAGNVIDSGINSALTESQVEEAVAESLAAPLDRKSLEGFRYATGQARDILYLGDNAGEIVFDRLLIEQLNCEKVTFVVRSGPIINDATMEDAMAAGLTDIVRVIDNGSNAPGTILEDCSEQFRRHFNEADLVIAKGQGNYETLSDVLKCRVIARHLGCEIGRWVLVDSKHDRRSHVEVEGEKYAGVRPHRPFLVGDP